MQVLIDGTNSPPYAEIQVGNDLANPGVARDIGFDADKNHIYVMTGHRVSGYPFIITVDSRYNAAFQSRTRSQEL